MNLSTRRRVLAAIIPTFTAGCTDLVSTSTTTPTETETVTSTSSTTTQQSRTHLEEFRKFLRRKQITIQKLNFEKSSKTVQLIYETRKTSNEELSKEIGTIAGGFFREIKNGWSASRLNAVVVDNQETRLATWYAKAEWYRQYQQGDISANDLSLRVLKTVERAGTE